MEEENIRYSEEEEAISEDGFLDDLTRDNYKSTPNLTEKELYKQGKDEARSMKKFILDQERDIKKQARDNKRMQIETLLQQKREAKRANKGIKTTNNGDDNDSLFGGEGTPILGRDKIVLLKKIKQYKSLFPDELAKFKVKKNPNVQELHDALGEMEVLVETNSVDGFLMDSVLQSMKLIENVSSYTKYDIRGCADLLKSNKQFHSLCKQLFIKYNVFSSVPAEYQLILLVSTTAYMCSNKNRSKGEINDYLNQTI